MGIIPRLKSILDQIASWPEDDQDELAACARDIEARRTGVYVMSDDERVAVEEGLAQLDRGEYVSDDVLAQAKKRYGL